MSNYTPTKLEVRSQYANDSFGSDEYLIAVAEFDRWLEAHNAEVVKETEERIIKLLEPYIGCRDELCYPYCSCSRSEFAIKLIKGEQK